MHRFNGQTQYWEFVIDFGINWFVYSIIEFLLVSLWFVELESIVLILTLLPRITMMFWEKFFYKVRAMNRQSNRTRILGQQGNQTTGFCLRLLWESWLLGKHVILYDLFTTMSVSGKSFEFLFSAGVPNLFSIWQRGEREMSTKRRIFSFIFV